MAAKVYTGTYADPSDLIAELRLKLVAGTEGYTENSISGDLDRLHLQKTMGGRTAYFNMAVISSFHNYDLHGIAANLSTGFDALEPAMEQPGSYETGSCGEIEVVDGGTYTLMADDDYLACTTVNSAGTRQFMILVSTPSCYGFFLTNSVGAGTDWGNIYTQDRFLWCFNNVYHHGCSVFNGTSWKYLSLRAYNAGVRPLFNGVATTSGLVPFLLEYSPNDVIGLPVLIPFTLFYGTDSSNTAQYPYDGPNGIKIINLKFLNDGDQIELGSDTYVVYQATNASTEYGIAFKITVP